MGFRYGRFIVIVVFLALESFAAVSAWNIDDLREILKNSENVDVVFPYALTEDGNVVQRRKRSVDDDAEDDVEKDVEDENVFVVKDWTLDVEANTALVWDRGLAAEWVAADGSVTRRPVAVDLEECRMKRGRVRGEAGSLVALAVCGGSAMTGLIHTGLGSYFIQPIDGGMHLNPHLIYRAKEELTFPLNNDEDFGENVKGSFEKLQNNFGKMLVNSSIDNSNRSTKYFLFDSHETLLGLEGGGRSKRESYWTGDRVETRKVNASDATSGPDQHGPGGGNEGQVTETIADRLKEGEEEKKGDGSEEGEKENKGDVSNLTNFNETRFKIFPDGYLVDEFYETEVKITRDSSGVNAPERWLEIALAADYTVIGFHKKENVQHFMLVLMNIVCAIYKDSSLASNMNLVIVRILLYEDKRSGVVLEGNSKRSLEKVNRWNERLLNSTPLSERHDIAVWLTRLDLGGPSGYAPVSGACDPARSCTLNRDEGLTSSFIIAHEMAHVLGLTHDGDPVAKNDCGREAQLGSVMAPMVSANLDHFTWSSCSRREFHHKASQWRCLANPPRGVNAIQLNSTINATYSMDEQCRLEFGDGYSLCRGLSLPEPCIHLWCGHYNTPLVCKTKKGPPLEGTECGVDKWCVNGYCEVRDRRWLQDAPPSPRDGGWTSWSAWTPCSRSCGVGVAFRTRRCENPKPEYGGNNCAGRSEEFRICSTQQCPQPQQDVRAQQCARLPALVPALVPLHRSNQTWLPHEPDPESQKCQLVCVSQESGEVLFTAENLGDGTPCSYDKDSDICIQGECQRLGCDGVLDSTMKRDSCGVCGGDNSYCHNVSNLFARRLRRGISRVVVLPRLARNIRIEANTSKSGKAKTMPSIKLALRDRRRRFFNLTSPEDRNDPRDQEPRSVKAVSTAKVVVGGTRFHYARSGFRETLWARGPLLVELVVVIWGAVDAELQSGVDVSVSSLYTMHTRDLGSGAPGDRYRWQVGGWGPCSQSCGGGKRVRTVACRDTQTGRLAPRRHCPLVQKPAVEAQDCNTFSCDFQWVPGDWEHCSTTCGSRGVQQRAVFCLHGAVVEAERSYPWRRMANPALCTGVVPPLTRPCNRVPCPAQWTPGNWSECSTSCGPGLQTRVALCPVPRTEPLADCGPPPNAERRPCRRKTRRDPLCRPHPPPCRRDASKYCSLTTLLGRYCAIPRFGELCCKSCQLALNELPEHFALTTG